MDKIYCDQYPTDKVNKIGLRSWAMVVPFNRLQDLCQCNSALKFHYQQRLRTLHTTKMNRNNNVLLIEVESI